MPSLGVPVNFSEINTASVICEIGVMHEGLTPDLSMGTHFFNDMVEMDILYMGFFPANKQNILNGNILMEQKDRLAVMLPDEKRWQGTVRVIDASDVAGGRIYLNADAVGQSGELYFG